MGNKLFGTDGVRGVANVYPMTAEFALKLGMAAGQLICRKTRRAAVARDTRISGEMLEAALTAGFNAAGVTVLKLGVVPTPAATMLTPSLGVDMTVMITASHNPYQDNGIKLINADGDKFSDAETTRIEAAIAADDFKLNPDEIGVSEAVPDAAAGYVDKALKAANGETPPLVRLAAPVKQENSVFRGETPLKGLRVVLDCANGVFSKILPEVFKSLGAGIIVIGNEPNGKNINLNCGSQHTEKMIETVKNAHAQLGIAVDGDGDRIIVCDEQGNRLDGDQIIAFLGKCLKEEGKLRGNTVVATIVSNPALDRFLNGCGIQCVRSAVGERYVIEEMKKHGANVGGEESGHMVLSDYGKTGDAMTAALVLAQGLLKSGKKMSELFPLFEPMLRLRADSKFATKEAMLAAFELPEFQAAIHQAEQTVAGKGKVLVRKSGTEPKIQVWVWSDDRNLAEKVNDEVSSVLEKAAGFETKKLV